MALLDSFTTIGGKNPVLFEDVIDLTMYDINDSPWSEYNIIESICNIIYYNYNTIINSGIYRVKYKDTNNTNKETVIFYSKNETYIDIYTLGEDGSLYKWSSHGSRDRIMIPIPTSGDVSDIINTYLNGLMISDLERKNQAFTYEINSQSDFDNTFLNANWSPAIGSSVKFNCSVEANEQNVVIPNNICKIEGNNNIISKIKSFGYANKYKLFSNTYYGGFCINNLTLIDPYDNNNMSNPFKGFVNCIYLYNCSVFYRYGHAYYANPRTGYYNCDNLINCKVDFASGGGGSLGLHNSCFGYSNCTNLINCTSRPNPYTGYYLESETEKIDEQDIHVSFYKCKNLINCISFKLGVAFGECDNLHNCVIDSNYSYNSVFNNNFIYCHNCYNCYNKGDIISSTDVTVYNDYSIFVNCENLNNCYYTNSIVYNGLINIFKDCDILKDCTGKMLNCTNVFNTEEVLKNQVTYKGPMSIDSFEMLWETGHNVKYGDCYTLYGGDGVNSLKTYNNTTIMYTSTYSNTIGDIINISNFDAISNGFKLSILDQMYIPLINNCNLLMIGNYECNIYKNDYDELFIKILDRSTQTYITSLPSGFLNINYTFYTKLIVSSDDKIIWREPGFWDVMSARTGFVTTI